MLVTHRPLTVFIALLAFLSLAVTSATGTRGEPPIESGDEPPRSISTDAKRKAQLHSDLGFVYLLNDQYDEAITEYTRAIGFNPSNALNYTYRADALGAKGQFDRAYGDLETSLRLKPKDAYAHVIYARCKKRAGKLEEAVQHCTAAIKLEPDDSSFIDRAHLFWELGNHAKALQDMTSAIERAGTDDVSRRASHEIRGRWLAHLGEFERAIDDLTESIRLDPTIGRLYVARGKCFDSIRDKVRALADCDEAIRVDAHDANARFVRAIMHRRRGNEAAALADEYAGVQLLRQDLR